MKEYIYIITAAAVILLTACGGRVPTAAETVAETAAETVAETATEAVAETVAETGTETATETVAETAAEAVKTEAEETQTSDILDGTGGSGAGAGVTDKMPEWLGIYENNDRELGITDFDGSVFRFHISASAGKRMDGFASVKEGELGRAEYGDLRFEYDAAADSVTVSAAKQQKDSSEQECFTGTYLRLPDPAWAGTYISEDGQTAEIKETDGNRLEITYRGYSEEGWHTDVYEVDYSDESRSKAVREAEQGISEEEHYTLTGDSLEIRTEPAGAWKDGIYKRQK